MRWPANVPQDVRQLADEVFDVLHGHDSDIVGPAIGIVFAFTILSLADRADDVAEVRFGAAVETQTH
jgi:hypothetical protein